MSKQAVKKQNIEIGMDFTTGPLLPLLIRFLLPFLLANLLNSLYNTVDTAIIGRFMGSTGIVACSLGGKMLNLFTNISVALAGGGQILVSQIVGAKRRDELNSCIGTMFSETIILSILFAIVTLLFSRNIIEWLNTPPEAFDDALIYLRITCIGLPLIFGYTAVSSVLRGMGDSRNPLIFIAIATVINIIGDLVFILVFKMGVAGAAVATVLGQGLSLVCSVVILYRRREYFGFDFKLKSFAIDWSKLQIILKLGLPNALRATCITGTQLVLMGYINKFGVVDSAAYSIGDKVYHMANILASSINNAGGTVVGQNFAAGNHERVRGIVRRVAVITLSASVFLSVFSLLFPTQIFGLFTDDPAVLAYAPAFMRVCCLIYVLSSFHASYQSVMSGTGNSFLNMIAGILDGMVLRVGMSFLFAYQFNLGVVGFFLADALARFAPITIGGIYYYSGAWKKRKKLV